MKSFRIFVLLLLAVLLPLRGTAAASMLCATPGETAELMAVQHDHAMHADHDGHVMEGDHADGAKADHAGSHHGGPGDDADSCNLCASGCNVTPLAAALPRVVEPSPTASVRFPALSVPVPAFQADGQERPPRSI